MTFKLHIPDNGVSLVCSRDFRHLLCSSKKPSQLALDENKLNPSLYGSVEEFWMEIDVTVAEYLEKNRKFSSILLCIQYMVKQKKNKKITHNT